MPWTGRPLSNQGLQGIRLLMMDVDGVLTQGYIALSSDGTDMRWFHSQDGVGLMVARLAGLQTGLITGRASEVVSRRAEELNITYLVMGTFSKLSPLLELCQKIQMPLDAVAFIGDDVADIPPMRRVGFAVAVANAVDEVKRCAHYITQRCGGEGAVRETVELILKAQGEWENCVAKLVGDEDWMKFSFR